jgi:Tol biopolymer transport system component
MKPLPPNLLRLALISCGLCAALLMLSLLVGWTLPAERIIFLSDDDGSLKLYGMDIGRGLAHKLNDVEILWTYALSPDGQRVLYMQTVNNQPAIFTMHLDGKPIHQFVDRPGISPAWSPDAQSIVFAMLDKRNFPTQLYRVRVDGTDLKPLTQLSATEKPFAPVWSPDGTQLLFQVSAVRNEISSYFMNADGSAMRRLTFPQKLGGIAYPQWSPDGQQVAFVGIAVNTENQAVTGLLCVTKVETAVSRCSNNYIAGQLSWSPDSQQIAYVSSKGYSIYEINIFDVETGETRRVLRYGENAGVSNVGYPIWTADGKRLIYQVSNIGNGSRGTQLHIINADGSGERRLTGGLTTSVVPTWWTGE